MLNDAGAERIVDHLLSISRNHILLYLSTSSQTEKTNLIILFIYLFLY